MSLKFSFLLIYVLLFCLGESNATATEFREAKVIAQNGSIFNIRFFSDHSIQVIEPTFGNLPIGGNANAICKSIDTKYQLADYDSISLGSNEIGAIGGINGTFTIGKIEEKITSVHCIDKLMFKVPSFGGKFLTRQGWTGKLGQLSVHVGDRDIPTVFVKKMLVEDFETSVFGESTAIESSCRKNGFAFGIASQLIQEELAPSKLNHKFALDFDSNESEFIPFDFDLLSSSQGFYNYTLYCASGKTIRDHWIEKGSSSYTPVTWPESAQYPDLHFGHSIISQRAIAHKSPKLEWPNYTYHVLHIFEYQAPEWFLGICQNGIAISHFSSGGVFITSHVRVNTAGGLWYGGNSKTDGDLGRLVCLNFSDDYSFKYEKKILDKSDKFQKILVQNARIESQDGKEVHYFADAFNICEALGMGVAGGEVRKSIVKTPGIISYSLEFNPGYYLDVNFSVSKSGEYIEEIQCLRKYPKNL